MTIYTYDSLPSTNELLMSETKKNATPWIVIRAIEQSAGKGYAGNRWESKDAHNLTFSFSLQTVLEFRDLILLNKWVAMILHTYLKGITPQSFIKWPNDLIINNKKVCGVLIESFKKNEQMFSVVGIGLNVNQTDFNHISKASSLGKETDTTYDIAVILADIMQLFQDNFHLVEEKKWEIIDHYYQEHLFMKDQLAVFNIPSTQEKIEGYIRSATNDGLLVVEINQQKKEFQHKEIQLLF